jgi:hypothetical protein
MKPLIVQESHHLELSSALMCRIQAQAQEAGVTPAKYIETLVVFDNRLPSDDPWAQPLPWTVEKQYLQDMIAFYEEDQQRPKPAARTAQELVALLQADETD